MTASIEAESLVKRYGDKHALDGVDLTVAPGTVCGLLGPNGAGKTTAVRIFTTLLCADGGTARVAGFDVSREPRQVRARIGFSGQDPAVDEILGGRQNLVIFARLNGLTKAAAGARADELLAQFGLEDAAQRSVKHYSGGMRRRLDLAVTLIQRPAVLFLDEPTTGLDPRSRNEMWSAIRALVAQGTTVLLTTQYLDEADQLADQIVVIDNGRVIADGTPAALKLQVGGDQLDIAVADAADLDAVAAILARETQAPTDVNAEQARVSAPVTDRVATLTRMLAELDLAGVEISDVALRRPTLDDVFLQLTGHRAEAEEVAA